MDKKKKGKCYFCGKEVTEDSFCYGCGEYVCDNCDKNLELMGTHNVTEHQKEDDEEW